MFVQPTKGLNFNFSNPFALPSRLATVEGGAGASTAGDGLASARALLGTGVGVAVAGRADFKGEGRVGIGFGLGGWCGHDEGGQEGDDGEGELHLAGRLCVVRRVVIADDVELENE